MGLRAALRIPRGVEEAVILTADRVSFALRNDGRRGVWEFAGDCAKSSTCVADFSVGNGWEGKVVSGGIEEFMVAMERLSRGG